MSHARPRSKERPLLGCYIFVQMPKQDAGIVRRVHGVEALLGVVGDPVAIPISYVLEFRNRYLGGEWDETAKGSLPLGARVEIMQGEFESYLGVLTSRRRGQAYGPRDPRSRRQPRAQHDRRTPQARGGARLTGIRKSAPESYVAPAGASRALRRSDYLGWSGSDWPASETALCRIRADVARMLLGSPPGCLRPKITILTDGRPNALQLKDEFF